MKHCTISFLPEVRITCVLATVCAFFLTGCVTDSDGPKPDSTHIFHVSLDNARTSLNCNSDVGGEAVIESKIEIFISTRDEGTPRKPDEETDYEVVTLRGGESSSIDLSLDAGFALEDGVLIEARITSSDSEGNFSLEEEFWHSVFYSLENDCWYNHRGANPFSGCIPGTDFNSELFETPHSTSMASPDCQVFFEWTAWIERI